jgi:hypothetical protein
MSNPAPKGSEPPAPAFGTAQIGPVRRQVRILMLLDAADRAGLAPLQVLRFHALAYLANVLAPVWEMPVLEGKVLKRNGGPFYPSLQQDVDRLVGMGLVLVTGLGHVQGPQGQWRLEGAFSLNRVLAQRPLAYLEDLDDERRVRMFVQELTYAFSALSDDDLDIAGENDAAYSDPLVGVGNVVDFGEWRHKNNSADAARYFDGLIPGGGPATRGEKLHLYARHLRERIHAEI